MKLGIGSYTYGWATGAYGFSDPRVPKLKDPMDVTDLIDRAVQFNVDYVQICFAPALHKRTDSELLSFKDYAEKNNKLLEIGTSGTDPELLRKYAEIAGILGAGLVRTIIPDASPGLSEEKKIISSILPRYEDYNVVLAIENHEDYACSDLASAIEEFNSDFLGVCLDTVNSLGRGEGTKEVVEILLPYTKSLHIKDFSTKRRPSGMGFEVTGAPAGSGKLDIAWLIRCAASKQLNISVILEQWSDYQGSLEESIEDQDKTAAGAIQYLKQLMNKYDNGR